MFGFILLCFISSAKAMVDPYVTKSKHETPVCDSSYVELENLPPIRDQGNYGVCYAHSTMFLLEHLRCAKVSNPTACYQDKGSVLHLARFDNTSSEDKIRIGGVPRNVFQRFRKTRKLSRENCASYEDWKRLDEIYKDETKKYEVPPDWKDENDFFYYVSRTIKIGEASADLKNCWANDIVNAGVQHTFNDVMAILNSAKEMNWQELRYKILVPKVCRQNSLQYPDYKLITYPTDLYGKKSYEGFRNFIFRALKAGHPVEASFCASKYNGQCSYHTAAITGQRHVCHNERCKLQFRMVNSYGKRWMERHDNGWLDAENLVNLMQDYSMGVSAVIAKGTKLNNGLISPFYRYLPLGKISDSTHKGEKCLVVGPGKSIKRKRAFDYAKGFLSNSPGKKITYICRSNGQVLVTDVPKAGMECRPR